MSTSSLSPKQLPPPTLCRLHCLWVWDINKIKPVEIASLSRSEHGTWISPPVYNLAYMIGSLLYHHPWTSDHVKIVNQKALIRDERELGDMIEHPLFFCRSGNSKADEMETEEGTPIPIIMDSGLLLL